MKKEDKPDVTAALNWSLSLLDHIVAQHKITRKTDQETIDKINNLFNRIKRHECREWDFMTITVFDPEFESCLCFNDRGYEAGDLLKTQEWVPPQGNEK